MSVRMAGGPHSVRSLSNLPARGVITFRNSPFSSNIGSQLTRSVEVATFTNFSPQYIQYLPSILAITCLPSINLVTIEADLENSSMNLPLYALRKPVHVFPRLKITRGGHCQTCLFAVPLCVMHYVKPVFCYSNTWVFATAGIFQFFLTIVCRIKYRYGHSFEV